MSAERILPKITFDVLNRQIESQALEIGQTIAGYEQSRREQGPLHDDWQMENEHFVILVCRSFHENGRFEESS